MADVRDSFRKVAANYTKSTFHASAVRLQEVVDLVRPKKGDLALDVATGTGNTALALAPHVRRVVGLDVPREVELRRDPSHIRSLTVEEWVEKLEQAGFEVESAEGRELDWSYEDWMGNMAIDPELSEELAAILESAKGQAREQLHPERRDGKLWHAYWHALIRAHRP